MPDIKAYSADNMVHVFPEGTDPNVIDRTMKRYAQTGGLEDPEAQAHQSLIDKMQSSMDNQFPAHDVDEQARRHPEQRNRLETGSSMAVPETLLGAIGLGPVAKSEGLAKAAKVAGRGLIGSMIGSYAGGHIGEFVGGETGKDIGEVGGGMYGGYKGVKGAEYKLPSWLGHFSTPEPPPYEPYEGGAGKLIDRVRGGSGEPSFGRPGVDLQRGKISPVPSAAAVEPEPTPVHEPYGGGSATRERLATRVRGRGEAGTQQYGRPGVDLQRGGISPVPESAPGETPTEKMGAGAGAPPKSPQEPAQGRPRGLKRDKPVSTGGLPSSGFVRPTNGVSVAGSVATPLGGNRTYGDLDVSFKSELRAKSIAASLAKKPGFDNARAFEQPGYPGTWRVEWGNSPTGGQFRGGRGNAMPEYGWSSNSPDKPASKAGGLPSKPRTPSMQKLVDRINELKGGSEGLTPGQQGDTLGSEEGTPMAKTPKGTLKERVTTHKDASGNEYTITRSGKSRTPQSHAMTDLGLVAEEGGEHVYHELGIKNRASWEKKVMEGMDGSASDKAEIKKQLPRVWRLMTKGPKD